MASTPCLVQDQDAFDRFAAAFAQTLSPGDVLALHGELGAGKTTFVRSLVRALHGNDDAVSSPTFVLRQTYVGVPTIEHLDLYRIDSLREAHDAGLDEAFGPDRITIVEWADRIPALLGSQPRHLMITGAGPGPRTFSVRA